MALGDVKYIAARPFDSHEGHHNPGELLPKSAAEWFGLQHLIGMGWVYAYASDTGYADLPPHVFSSVVTLQEARGLIQRGDAPVELEWNEPPELVQAKEERDAELESHEKNAQIAHEAAVKLLNKKPNTEAVEFHMPQTNEDVKKREAEAIAADDDSDKYSDLSKTDLEEEIAKRNNQKSRADEDHIPVTGTKPELVQRLIEDDRKK